MDIILLGWPKKFVRVFQKMVQKNLNEVFGQPNVFFFLVLDTLT